MRNALIAGLVAAASPAFAQTAPLTPIEQTALAKDAFAGGALSRAEGALPTDLWRGADAAALMSLLAAAPARPDGPSTGAALRRVLLSPGDSPADATPALGGAKLKALVKAGHIEEARAIAGLSTGVGGDPASTEALSIADLLTDDRPAACEKGRRGGQTLVGAFWVRLRVICYAAANELDAAELALGILRESGGLGEADEEILSPLTIGAKLKTPVAPVDAVHYAALKLMGAPVTGAQLDRADAGVIEAAARDASFDWPTRLAAATKAVAMGAMNAAELKALHAAAPSGVAGAYQTIAAMSAPELLRDKVALIASEISAAGSFDGVYAAALLYTDDIRTIEGAIVPPAESIAIALAALAAGDAVGAERWLTAAAPEMLRGLPEDISMKYIDLAGVLSVLEPAAAGRIAAAANIAIAPPRPAIGQGAAPPRSLAAVVGAAIDAAEMGGRGLAGLAALAAADAAGKGDPVADIVVTKSLALAGMDDLNRRRAVEIAIAAMFPETAAPAEAIKADAAAEPKGMTPRLKPKRTT